MSSSRLLKRLVYYSGSPHNERRIALWRWLLFLLVVPVVGAIIFYVWLVRSRKRSGTLQHPQNHWFSGGRLNQAYPAPGPSFPTMYGAPPGPPPPMSHGNAGYSPHTNYPPPHHPPPMSAPLQDPKVATPSAVYSR